MGTRRLSRPWSSRVRAAGSATDAATAGRAVLEVMRAERLRERAAELAPVLRAGLHAVAATSPGIGAVRGQGLFQGVDFVDPATGGPDGESARAVVEGVRRAGVLISRTGRHGNVLTIRPPPAIEEDDVRTLLDRLAEVVADVAAGTGVGVGARDLVGRRPS
ncbi:aminotransferase class III-fold pyridoxal phosphate-dependent enzyme [Kineococcus sp. SYSU DK002]|uniref:aminotransferase class III-fold pyridoxal phosphate-dependent enzyme n=1 Tax=Kineococcus sp. SYSU DK002 TaxID=3383123 RepID=UPI003D7C4720